MMMMMTSTAAAAAVARRSAIRCSARFFSKSEIRGPSTKLKSWESGARLVKDTQRIANGDNAYLDHIRDMHDPSLHLKTIEDELKGTIGKALGKQADKIFMYMRCMDQEFREYKQRLEEDNDGSGPDPVKLNQVARKYNDFRKQAIQARWELIVHRQAVGFIVNNHKFVMDKFPIAEALPEDGDLLRSADEREAEKKRKEKEIKKKFGDQLDWWQRIGRWR